MRVRHMRGGAGFGQSWFQGGTTVTIQDAWLAPTTSGNNWNGQVTTPNATYSQEQTKVSLVSFPNLFCSRDINNPSDIGPYFIPTNANGNQLTGETHSPNDTGENMVPGWMAQVNAHYKGAMDDWALAGYGAGGATIAILAFYSVDPATIPVQQLKSMTMTSSDYFLKVLRQILYQFEWAQTRNQVYTCDFMLWDQGHSDGSNAAYQAAFYAFYDKFNAFVKRITGQSHDVAAFVRSTIGYSTDGHYSGSGVGAFLDQQFLDIEDNRGTRPIYCVGPNYPRTNFIHPPKIDHRALGERDGKAFTRIMFDGEAYGCLRPKPGAAGFTYAVGGTTIDIDLTVRAGRTLTIGATNDNNIALVQQVNGINTHGLSYFKKESSVAVTISNGSPSVVSWAGHGLANGAKVRFRTDITGSPLFVQGSLPSPLAKYTDYYVVNSASGAFSLALTAGGAAINTTTAGSGAIHAYDVSTQIASVAIVGGKLRVTLDNPIAAGDIITGPGLDSRYSNICDGAADPGIFQNIDWAGATWAGNQPTFKLGALNDCRYWLNGFKKAL